MRKSNSACLLSTDRSAGLKANRKRSFRPVTTDSKHKLPVAPNLLDQVFKSDGLNRIWLSDITYIPINGKWIYLFAIKDLFNREIVGWELGSTLETTHFLKGFEKALSRRGYPKSYFIPIEEFNMQARTLEKY